MKQLQRLINVSAFSLILDNSLLLQYSLRIQSASLFAVYSILILGELVAKSLLMIQFIFLNKVIIISQIQIMASQLPLKAIIQHLTKKPKLQVATHYKYDMRSVIMSLNNNSIDILRQEFIVNKNKIDLQRFLWLMHETIDSFKNNEQFIYYELVKLFEQIDIDNSNTIQWSQFLEYLSESGWVKSQSVEGADNTRNEKIIYFAYEQDVKYRKYPIHKIVQLPKRNLLALLQTNNSLSFITYDTRPEDKYLEPQKFEYEQPKCNFFINHIDNNKVVSLDYSDEEKLFGILLSNRNTCFIENGQIQKVCGTIKSTGTEINIKFLYHHKLWLLESSSSVIQIFSTPKGQKIDKKIVFKSHSEPLSGISEIVNSLTTMTLCTSSLDGTIRLWKIDPVKLTIEFNPFKQKIVKNEDLRGIKGIDTINYNGNSVICSWMFSNEIYLWQPSKSLSKPFAGQLKGHYGLIVDCKFVNNSQLASLDDKGVVKIWSVQKLEVVQQFHIQNSQTRFYSLRSKPYFIVYSKILNFYRIRTNTKLDTFNEIQVIKNSKKNVLFNSEIENIKLIDLQFSQYQLHGVSLTSEQIKFFEINTSNLIKSIFPDDNEEKYVAMCMKNDRRIYIASSFNNIYEYRIEDGKLLSQLAVFGQSKIPNQQTQCQLKFIYYHIETRIMIVVLEKIKSSKIMTFQQLQYDTQIIKLKQIQFDFVNLKNFGYSEKLQMFFISSEESIITVWSYEKMIIVNSVDTRTLFNTDQDMMKIIVQQNQSIIVLLFKTFLGLLSFNEKGQIVQGTKLKQKSINSHSYFTDISINKSQVEKDSDFTNFKTGFQKTAKVIFKESQFDQSESQFGSSKMTFQTKTNTKIFESQEKYVISVANNLGQINFYDIDFLLKSKKINKSKFRGRNFEIKQSKLINLIFMHIDLYPRQRQLDDYAFHGGCTYIKDIVKIGSLINYFYAYDSSNVLSVFDNQAKIEGKWTLVLNKPSMWNVSYNQISHVLQRLKKTLKALKKLQILMQQNFEKQFLIEKYIDSKEIAELLRKQQQQKLMRDPTKKSKTTKKITIDNSMKKIASIQNILEENKAKDKQIRIKEMRQLKNIEKKQQNIFLKKQEQKEQIFIKQKQKKIEQKVRKCLSYSKIHSSQANNNGLKNIPQFIHKKIQIKNGNKMLMQRLQNELDNIIFNQPEKTNEKEVFRRTPSPYHKFHQRKPSAGIQSNFMSQKTNSKELLLKKSRPSTSIVRPRISSSLNELQKIFNQTKVQHQNCISKINMKKDEGRLSSLKKKKKVPLVL